MEYPTPVISLFAAHLKQGGIGRVMATLANALAEEGLNVELLLQKREGEFLALLSPNVRIVDIGGRRMVFCLYPLWLHLRRTRPDVMLASGLAPNILASSMKFLPGITTRMVLREPDHFATRQTFRSLPKRIAVSVLVRLYRRADRVIAVSEGVAEGILAGAGMHRDQVVVIPNPSWTQEMVTLAQENVTHPWFQENNKIPVALAVNRLAPEKGLDTLLDAVAEINRTRPLRLLVLGEGSERQALEVRIEEFGLQDKVHLPGFELNPFRFMARASVFVLASRLEGLPNVLIQALGCGCPVVATDCPSGAREVLAGSAYGALVPVGDAKALAAAMVSALDAPVDRIRLKRRAMDFRPEAIVPRYREAMGI